ncbi:MAG: UDP-N-acetylmuramoyl-tripeptide--D-alanyl-D-alanine ligase [Sinobacterium sp.]|nr:UDP-N-acetylmuramoyl-tripeptide--D-alanyl-D-alanine ligase [Sinobacterium sp.]
MSKFSVAFAIASLLDSDELNASLNISADAIKDASELISTTVIDSRLCCANSLFVAFAGEHVDGHDYIDNAKALGAKLVLVERFVDADIAQIKVSNCQQGLAILAKAYRCSWNNTKVVALTGSAGKTSTKDILAFLLSRVAVTQSTQGNLNNELGLPLTLLNTNVETQYLVAEMGAGEVGDIAYLADIAQPDVGLITNIGDAHIGRFGSADAIAETKTELFTGMKKPAVAVLNADDEFYPLFKEKSAHVSSLSFSYQNNATNIYSSLSAQGNFILNSRDNSDAIELQLPFTAKHQRLNYLAAVACIKALGLDINLCASIAQFKEVSVHRQLVIPLSNNVDLIDDTYNSSPAAMKVAIDYAVSLKEDGRRLVLLFGAMAELGEFSDAKHVEITQYAIKAGFTHFIYCGDACKAGINYCESVDVSAELCESSEAVAKSALKEIRAGDIVLAKGSRAIKLDEAVEIIVDNEKNNTWGYSACC